MTTVQNFSTIAGGFTANIQALRVFAERIGRHADKHDRAAVNRFIQGLEESLPPNVRLVVDRPRTAKRRGAVKKTVASRDSSPDGEPASKNPELAEALKKPAVQEAVVKAIKALGKEGPVQGALLRRSALVTLMSQFEALVADLVHAYYGRFPAALPGELRSLTLAELRELGSIDDAVQFLVNQEVDVLLRESLEKQIQYFAKPLKADVKPLDDTLPRLIEIDQRRNIYVHNRGTVNRQYLSRVAPALVNEFEAKDGKTLPVNDQYLGAAIDTVFTSGLILLMQCWAKWAKAEADERDAFLVNVTFEALQESRYEVVRRIATFGVTGPVLGDEERRILIINHAAALKETVGEKEMGDLLATMDWSATGPRFKLVLASLQSNETEFFLLLPKALASDEVAREHLEEWPVYSGARQFKDFANELQRHAPRPAAALRASNGLPRKSKRNGSARA